MRTIIVGDIHGCHGELMELLEEAAFSVWTDRLIFVGDYIDRGRESYEVIEEVMKLEGIMGERLIALRGNHEQLMLDFLLRGERRDLWFSKGAAETLSSFEKHGGNLARALKWISGTRLFYETDSFIVAHASVSEEGPEKTSEYTLLFEREDVKKAVYSGKLLIHGHTHMEHAVYQPGTGETIKICDKKKHKLPETGSICLDTSCVYGNRLTAMVIEGENYYLKSVRADKQYK